MVAPREQAPAHTMLADTTLLKVRHVAKPRICGEEGTTQGQEDGGGVIGGASASLLHQLLGTSTSAPLCVLTYWQLTHEKFIEICHISSVLRRT